MDVTISIASPKQIGGLAAAAKQYNDAKTLEIEQHNAGLQEESESLPAHVPFTPAEYLSLAVDAALTSYAIQFSVGVVPAFEFSGRFTPIEYAAIMGSVDPLVVGYVAKLRTHPTVDLTHADTTSGVGYLEMTGLIAPGRGTEILAI